MEMGLGNQYGPGSVSMPPALNKKTGKEVNPNDIGLLSIPKQTKIFVEALRHKTESEGNKILEFQDMVDLGKRMNLQTGDFK